MQMMTRTDTSSGVGIREAGLILCNSKMFGSTVKVIVNGNVVDWLESALVSSCLRHGTMNVKERMTLRSGG